MANRIIIITNLPGDADTLTAVLGSARDGPFEVEWVRHLSTALKRLRMGGIDAILVDLSLPDSHGIATFDQLFAAAPHTPIMTLSVEDDALAVEAVQRGAQGYLLKEHLVSSLVPQTLRNIIQRKAVEDAFYKEKARAEIALNSIGDAVICTDMEGIIDYLNIAAEKMTGWSRLDASGHALGDVFKIINGITGKPERNTVELVLEVNKSIGLPPDTVLVRRDGSHVSIEDSAAPINDWDGQPTGVVIVFHDVSLAQSMAKKMAHLAQHDFLTNLPNRALLNDRIAHAIILSKRNNSQLAVLFLDLDNFKHINDSLGHATGDKLLQSVTQRLSGCVRGSDTVSRQGGDEFVILLAEGKSEEDAAATANKILGVLALPHSIDQDELYVTTSIGISIYPADGEDAETLIKSADIAMYHAKEKGRNNFQFFRSSMNIRAVERQLIEANLRTALEKNEFVLHYQPKVNLDTGLVTGVEALLRWIHPDLGMVLPARFMRIAEDCGLIVPIGRWVLLEACTQAKRWVDAGLMPISIAVNISAVEFRQKHFFEGVRTILNDTGLDPGYLELEITESVLMRDAQASAAILQELKNMGVQLAVDDFGTGYSSLSYLERFPIDVLKIDQSFVRDIAIDTDNGIIVSAVIGMGNNLKLRVIAEGIENQAQLSFLKSQNCEEGQGYFFSHPITADQFYELRSIGNCQIGGI
ncbi:MAG: EAL domain-containing protein [Undibacterium sp.]|uniref:putative bifunctional diguanylate cyclase/phosphodiesterase n=1 Tax=Undibacterium sp. TaxID=1914977 RepID=UPI002717450F|nr:EAL domain-containing protein [Undibacterium sp.]MDO8654469.1 EAL domain-containing protein [Undibacterium sp.]